MFTGIIETLGTVAGLEDRDGGREFVVNADNGYFKDTTLGDSIAMNGVCLTATAIDGNDVTVFAQIETLSKTSLGSWSVGDTVNIELPMRVGDRLGGHIVQGHVDCTTKIVEIQDLADGSCLVTLKTPQDITKYIVDRGSICLNGVSLTIASKEADRFVVALIPATLEKTIFGKANVGDIVNVEVDAIARYVEQMMK